MIYSLLDLTAQCLAKYPRRINFEVLPDELIDIIMDAIRRPLVKRNAILVNHFDEDGHEIVYPVTKYENVISNKDLAYRMLRDRNNLAGWTLKNSYIEKPWEMLEDIANDKRHSIIFDDETSFGVLKVLVQSISSQSL